MSFFILGFLIVLIFIVYKSYKNTEEVMVNHIRLNDFDRNERVTDKQMIAVLHISDMHVENISVSPEQLYEKLQDQKIDLIALTGDFLDRKRSIPKLVCYLQMLNKLHPKYGMYAVFGNHDYVLPGKHFDHLRRILHEHGCKTLQNENNTLDINGNRLNIIGIDDCSTNRSDLSASFSGIEQGYNLVLTHDPNIVLEMNHYDFDYLLAGHFHGGQIHWPKPYHLVKMGKLARLKMIKGLHYYNGNPFYISEGLGQTALNIRIGSRPEITFHYLPISRTSGQKNEIHAAV